MKSLGVCYSYVKMRVYGAWIMIYYILCPKTYGIFDGLFWSPAGSRQAARSGCICETSSLENAAVKYWRPLVNHPRHFLEKVPD